MTPNEYQRLAMETEANQGVILDRMYNEPGYGTKAMRLDNAARGLSDDAGEINSAVKKYIEYGQPLDEVNLKEEVGDCMWRLAQVCKAIGITLEEAMEANIRKLHKARYKDGYSDKAAANRDLDAEREAIENKKIVDRIVGKVPGWYDGDRMSPMMPEPSVHPETVEQNGHGFAEPPEIGGTIIERADRDELNGRAWEDRIKNAPGSKSLYPPRPRLNPDGSPYQGSYDRLCGRCSTPIHRNNSAGLCSSCYMKIRRDVKEATSKLVADADRQE